MERDPVPHDDGLLPGPEAGAVDPTAAVLAAVEGLRAVLTAGDLYRFQAAAFFGLGISDTYAVSNLHLHGAMTQSELGRRIGVSTSGVTGLVDRLERAGVARRIRDSTDRRRMIVELTEDGRAVMSHSRSRLMRVFEGVDAKTLTELTDRLHVIADRVAAEAEGLETGAVGDRPTAPPPTATPEVR